MTKEVIQKYIQFAIENGYDELPIMEEGWYYIEDYILTITIPSEGIIEYEGNIYEIITSKEFIEAVARGIVWSKNIENQKDFKKEDLVNYDFSKEVNDITIKQAIAIRENSVDGVSLEEFILELIK